MAANALKTDFDDEIDDTPKSSPAVSESVDKDEDGIPYCVKHHCRMKQTSGGKKGSSVAYYACPVNGCEEKAKRIKTSKPIIPNEPHLCPRCTKVSPRPIMERDAARSNAMYTILKCPCCGYKSAPMPRPEFVQNHAEARKRIPEPDIGAR
jgi:hypothetical protein